MNGKLLTIVKVGIIIIGAITLILGNIFTNSVGIVLILMSVLGWMNSSLDIIKKIMELITPTAKTSSHVDRSFLLVE
jgi:hypothetical protein